MKMGGVTVLVNMHPGHFAVASGEYFRGTNCELDSWGLRGGEEFPNAATRYSKSAATHNGTDFFQVSATTRP